MGVCHGAHLLVSGGITLHLDLPSPPNTHLILPAEMGRCAYQERGSTLVLNGPGETEWTSAMVLIQSWKDGSSAGDVIERMSSSVPVRGMRESVTSCRLGALNFVLHSAQVDQAITIASHCQSGLTRLHIIPQGNRCK